MPSETYIHEVLGRGVGPREKELRQILAEAYMNLDAGAHQTAFRTLSAALPVAWDLITERSEGRSS